MNFESPEIPSDWKCLQIGSFSRTMAGGTPSTIRSDFWDGDVPWINSGALKNLEIKSPSRFITKLGLQNSAAKLVPAGSAVIALTGATTGMVGLLTFECATNQSVVAVVPNNSAISAYLFYFLMFARPHVLSFATGAAQPHINKGVVDRLLVPLPPLPEQEKIAHLLSTVHRAIEAQERIIQTTTELKKALMHKLFT
jgi:type I restriction enzyme S subunit